MRGQAREGARSLRLDAAQRATASPFRPWLSFGTASRRWPPVATPARGAPGEPGAAYLPNLRRGDSWRFTGHDPEWSRPVARFNELGRAHSDETCGRSATAEVGGPAPA